MSSVTTISEMDLDGGVACLDLVNSGLSIFKDEKVERLHTYADLLILTGRLGLLNKRTLDKLSRTAVDEPGQARRALQQALEARKVMASVFGALADGELDKLDSPVLEKFNSFISNALKEQHFIVSAGLLELSGSPSRIEPDLPLLTFILSAYELLTNKEQRYIKRCGRCQWLFLDETKSHRRKWCSMKDCGSIEKAKRYYNRKKMGGV